MNVNVWRIGTQYGPKGNIFAVFREHNVVFAGGEDDDVHRIREVKPNDLIAVTKGMNIAAIGQAKALISLKDNPLLFGDYGDIPAMEMNTFFVAPANKPFGSYDGARAQFHKCHGDYLDMIKKIYLQQLENQKMQRYMTLLKANKNLILTGAPGTGKTFLAQEIAKQLIIPAELKNTIEDSLFQSFQPKLPEDIKNADDNWKTWKERILSDDFSLDEYANIKAHCAFPHYLMYFLERGSNAYGSSKPRDATHFGVKLNTDNTTYTLDILNNKLEIVDKEKATDYFEAYIKPYLQQLLKASLSEKIKLVDAENKIIKARQLLRKIVVLEHPTEVLGIYQDETVDNACNYYKIPIEGKGFLQKNIELYQHFLEKYKLEATVENQFKVYYFIWRYFNKKEKEKRDIEEDSQNANQTAEESRTKMIETYIHEHIAFVQFHPSYDYTDFVEGLRPIKKGDNLGFELKNGIFKDFCKKAKEDSDNNYVFIIDEINRAEISKVFGELFFALDPGYRGEKGRVKTQYANVQTEETYFTNLNNDYFYVPENVYIIGTMNDIDRSIETFDFAMRRRFVWLEVTAEERKSMWDDEIPKWKQEAAVKMEALNNAIDKTEGLNSSFHLGPAYFLNLKNYDGDFKQLWANHLEVLLKEYLRGMPDAKTNLETFKKAYNGVR